MVPEYERLLTKVAHLYYIEDKSQTEISGLLSLSKSKVCRLLAEARSQGVVEIYVNGTLSWCPALESRIEKKYGLKEACIVEVPGDRPIAQTLGFAGAQLLKRLMSPKDILGISWGKTLLSLVSNFHESHLKGPRVVQLVGCLNMGGEDMQVMDLLRRLGEYFETRPLALFCPSIVSSPQVKAGLMEDPKIAEVVRAARRCTIVLAGIGELSTTSTLYQQGYISPAWWQALTDSGAVGNMCMNFYNADGEACCSAFQEVTMTMTSLSDLKEIPTVIGIAGGAEKLSAIRGALRSGALNILLTDRDTAEALL